MTNSTDNTNYQHENLILSYAIGSDKDISTENKLLFKFVSLLHKQGFLRSRAIRFILNINIEAIDIKITKDGRLDLIEEWSSILEKKWNAHIQKAANKTNQIFEHTISNPSNHTLIIPTATKQTSFKKLTQGVNPITPTNIKIIAPIKQDAPIKIEVFKRMEGYVEPMIDKKGIVTIENAFLWKNGDYYLRPPTSFDEMAIPCIVTIFSQGKKWTYKISEEEDGCYITSRDHTSNEKIKLNNENDLLKFLKKDLNLAEIQPVKLPFPLFTPSNNKNRKKLETQTFAEEITQKFSLAYSNLEKESKNKMIGDWILDTERKNGDFCLYPSEKENTFSLIVFNNNTEDKGIKYQIEKTENGYLLTTIINKKSHEIQIISSLDEIKTICNAQFPISMTLKSDVDKIIPLDLANPGLSPKLDKQLNPPSFAEEIMQKFCLAYSNFEKKSQTLLTGSWINDADRKNGDFCVYPSNKQHTFSLIVFNNETVNKGIKYQIEKAEAGYLLTTFISQKANNPTQIINSLEEIKTICNAQFPISMTLKSVTEPQLDEAEVANELLESSVTGMRTALSNNFLKNISTYDGFQLKYKDNQYQPVSTGQTHLSNPKALFASIGSFERREIITLDPNSPELLKHYENLQQLIFSSKKKQTTETVMTLINYYIRNHMFENCTDPNLKSKMNTFVDSYLKKNPDNYVIHKVEDGKETPVPVIPIEEFLTNKIGVCRHHGLIATFFLDKLSREYGGTLMPKGIAQQIRDNIPSKHGKPDGAHVWVSFVETDTGTQWHLDTLWNIIEETSSTEGKLKLEKDYGKKTIDNLIQKTAPSRTKRIKS